MSVRPFRAYEIYSALKLHFSSDYDATKYNFKTRAKLASFEKSGQRFLFDRLAEKFPTERDAIIFFTAQMVDNPRFFVTNYDESLARELVAYVDAADYRFKKEMKVLLQKYGFTPKLYSTGENYPQIVEAYLQKEIQFPTMAILYKLLGGTGVVKLNTSRPVVWADLERSINKFNELNLIDYRNLYGTLEKLLSESV